MLKAGAEKIVNMRGRNLTAKEKMMLNDHEERLVRLENDMSVISDIADTVTAIKKYIKIYAPIIVTAAVSSGVVSGKWGAFFNALFGG